MREDIEFLANGTTLRGWFFKPEGDGPFPCVVIAHGFSAVKEQNMDEYAEVFRQAGLASVVFDHRCLGASDGLPRQDIDPYQHARDYRDAITYAQLRDDVDADRIGIWGTSYSGGEVLMVAGVDRRVKAVVSQVPLISGLRNTRRLLPEGNFEALRQQILDDRIAQQRGEAPGLIKITSDDPNEPHCFPGPRTFNYFTKAAARPEWRNECTIRSLDYLLEWDSTPYIETISPTPLLMIVSNVDTSAPPDEATAAFNLAREPKQLHVLPGDHYGSYLEDFDESAGVARDFLVKWLVK